MQNRDRLISVRKLASLDLALHGSMRIRVEFAVGMLLTGFLGLWLLYRGLLPGPNHSLETTIWGCVLLGIGLNYLPLLIYSFKSSQPTGASNEVASGLAQTDAFRRMYTLQSAIFILVPFALLILAIVQAARRPQS
jgi:hypothetical protein